MSDDLFILPPKWFFVKPYFLEAFELSELGHSRSFSEQNVTFSASIGSFQGLPAGASEVILLPQRLALKYNTTPPPPCQHFLTGFFIFFCVHPKTAANRRKNCAAATMQLRRAVACSMININTYIVLVFLTRRRAERIMESSPSILYKVAILIL